MQIKKLINKDSIAKLTPYKLQRLFRNDLKKEDLEIQNLEIQKSNHKRWQI